jgi:hypothetical protein
MVDSKIECSLEKVSNVTDVTLIKIMKDVYLKSDKNRKIKPEREGE